MTAIALTTSGDCDVCEQRFLVATSAEWWVSPHRRTRIVTRCGCPEGAPGWTLSEHASFAGYEDELAALG